MKWTPLSVWVPGTVRWGDGPRRRPVSTTTVYVVTSRAEACRCVDGKAAGLQAQRLSPFGKVARDKGILYGVCV